MNPNTKIRIPFILFLAVGWTAATAASFDCAKAATYVETAICGNQDLSRLDEDAAHLFAEAIKRNVGTEAELRENQKAWLKKRNQCGTEDCILSTYLDRRGWYFSQMISVTSAQDDFRRASEIAQGSKLHLVLYGTPELGRDEGSNHDRRLFCEGFLEDFKSFRKLRLIEPYAMAERYDDPAFDAFRQSCPKLDMHKLSEGAGTVQKTTRATDDYGFLFTPSHHFKLYHVDLDNAPENGVEHVFYAESFFSIAVNRNSYNYYTAWDLASCSNFSSENIHGAIDHSANVPIENFSGIVNYLGKNYVYNLFRWAPHMTSYNLRLSEVSRSSAGARSSVVCVYSEIDCCEKDLTWSAGKGKQ